TDSQATGPRALSATEKSPRKTGALFVSRFYVVIFLLQIVPAVLLLANRYVPLALTILGAVIVNILCFHIFMAPAGLPLAVVVTVLWFFTTWSVRSAFAGILQR